MLIQTDNPVKTPPLNNFAKKVMKINYSFLRLKRKNVFTKVNMP